MLVDSKAVSLVILPRALLVTKARLTFKIVTVRVPELSLSTRLVVLPIAFVAGAIRPSLHAMTVPHFVLPLS